MTDAELVTQLTTDGTEERQYIREARIVLHGLLTQAGERIAILAAENDRYRTTAWVGEGYALMETKFSHLLAAIRAEHDAFAKYEQISSDRGGAAGPKGQAYQRWIDTRFVLKSLI